MKTIFSNIWIKRLFSIVSVLYAAGVCRLCYYSIFYDIHIATRTTVLLITVFGSLAALLIMLYSRKQILTRLASFVILPAMLPVVLLYFGEWEIIIPIVITGVVILLLSGAGEGTKTALGTIILLLYIFGALGYFLFTSFFVSSAKETVVKSGVSPSERYRYYVVNTEDTSNGSTCVYIEPNYADVKYKYVTFTLKNMEKIVYQERPICEEINIEWETQSRQDITEKLEKLSDSITVSLSDEELEQFGYSIEGCWELDELLIEDRFYLGQTASDVDPVKLDTLDEEQLAYFGIGRDNDGRYYVRKPTSDLLDVAGSDGTERLYFTEMDSKSLEEFNDTYDYFVLNFNRRVLLSELSDEQLGILGVSETGDVLSFNGKICFRYYVAELEDYFDTESRKLSLDLLG
ncbi:MAG: hypothetical protein IJ874_01740 [Ruminococcus sp.]|nr:hypothetical protein [Ruminococcus sp.]